jgi:spore maturation protein CgeE
MEVSLKSSLYHNLLDLEQVYKYQFCNVVVNYDYVVFENNILPDMYDYNHIYVPKNVSKDELICIIEKEMMRNQHMKIPFVQVEYEGCIKKIEVLGKKSQVKLMEYYVRDVFTTDSKPIKPTTSIKKGIDYLTIKNYLPIDILNGESCLSELSLIKRINRKMSVYIDPDKIVDLFFIYQGDIVIGTCEFMIYNKIGVIKDVCIDEPYQSQEQMINIIINFIELGRKKHVQYISLITEYVESTKNVYLKNGFECVGQKTVLFFDFT